MKEKKQNKIISAMVTIALGILFLIWQGQVISFAMTVLGAALLVSALFDLLHRHITLGVIKAIIGVLIITCGWMFISIALYVMAACLLINSILQCIDIYKGPRYVNNRVAQVLQYLQPVFSIAVAVCLLFHQGEAIAWTFILSGIFLIAEGVLALANCLRV